MTAVRAGDARLRRVTASTIGTLKALEPDIGVLLGLVVLRQPPSAAQLVVARASTSDARINTVSCSAVHS